jgi:hypothetical protein
MPTVEEAIALWRARRENISEDRTANIEAWIVELQGVLAELGLTYEDLVAHLADNPRNWIENEYDQMMEASLTPLGP